MDARPAAAWGLSDAHLEAWGPFGRGWTLKRFSAQVIEPQCIPLIAFPKAWSPGTEGTLTAPVIYFDAKTEADFARFKGKIKGAIVLTARPPRHRPLRPWASGRPTRSSSRWPMPPSRPHAAWPPRWPGPAGPNAGSRSRTGRHGGDSQPTPPLRHRAGAPAARRRAGRFQMTPERIAQSSSPARSSSSCPRTGPRCSSSPAAVAMAARYSSSPPASPAPDSGHGPGSSPGPGPAGPPSLGL